MDTVRQFKVEWWLCTATTTATACHVTWLSHTQPLHAIDSLASQTALCAILSSFLWEYFFFYF